MPNKFYTFAHLQPKTQEVHHMQESSESVIAKCTMPSQKFSKLASRVPDFSECWAFPVAARHISSLRSTLSFLLGTTQRESNLLLGAVDCHCHGRRHRVHSEVHMHVGTSHFSRLRQKKYPIAASASTPTGTPTCTNGSSVCATFIRVRCECSSSTGFSGWIDARA
jgi:hypothetical protein